MSRLSVDASLAPELVEFWGHRYREVKAELDQIKDARVSVKGEHSSPTEARDTLQDAVEKRRKVEQEFETFVETARTKEGQIKGLLESAEHEKNELAKRLTLVEADREKQRETFRLQATYLAEESDRARQTFIDTHCASSRVVEGEMYDSVLIFGDPQAIISKVPPGLILNHQLCFLPRPPASMPLRVQARGRAGYWFHPIWTIGEGAEFELVVEGRPGEWSYLGRYVTSFLPGQDMRLSEWLVLDDRTKMSYAARIANQNAQTKPVSRAEQIAVKQRYDIGEWVVPCYLLRCVGFDVALYNSLLSAMGQLHTTPHLHSPPPPSTLPPLSKRRRSSEYRSPSPATERERERDRRGDLHVGPSTSNGRDRDREETPKRNRVDR